MPVPYDDDLNPPYDWDDPDRDGVDNPDEPDGDRSILSGITEPGMFNVYTNQTYQSRVGPDALFVGNIAAPFAEVTIFSGATFDGCIHANVFITNDGTECTVLWTVTIDAGDSVINTLWNGILTEPGGDYQVDSMAHNGAIYPGGSRFFGFCATKTGPDYLPEITSATAL